MVGLVEETRCCKSFCVIREVRADGGVRERVRRGGRGLFCSESLFIWLLLPTTFYSSQVEML